MVSIERKQQIADAIPQYPGKRALEAAVRPLVTVWARKKSAAIVMRLIGYHAVWTVTPGGRSGIIDRGWMSRPAAYAAEADFRKVFGVSVEEFDPAQIAAYLGVEDPDGAASDGETGRRRAR
jgi:hypothetical protein